MLGKKRVVIPLLILGLIALGLALAYAERREIASYAVRDYLRELGVEDPRLTFTDLTFERVEAADIYLGGEQGLDARAIRLEFGFLGDGLIPDALDLKRVEIEGLDLYVNLIGEGDLLPGLTPLLAGPDSEPDSAPFIAFDPLRDAFDVTLMDSRLIIETAQGPINARLESQIERNDQGGMAVHVSGGGDGPGGRADGEARLSFQDERLTRAQVDLHLVDFALADLNPEALFLSLEADEFSLAVQGDLLLPDSYLGGFAYLQSDEPLVPLAEPPGALEDLTTLLLNKDWRLQAQLSGENLYRQGVAEALTFSTSFDLEKEDGTWRVLLPETTRLTANRLSAASLTEGLPDALIQLVDNPFELELSGPSEGAFLIGKAPEGLPHSLPNDLSFKGAVQMLSALSSVVTANGFGKLIFNFNNRNYLADLNIFLRGDGLHFGDLGAGQMSYRGRVQAEPEKLVADGVLESLSWQAEIENRPLHLTAQNTQVRARLDSAVATLDLGPGLRVESDSQDLPILRPDGPLRFDLKRLLLRQSLDLPEALEAEAELRLQAGDLLVAGTSMSHEPIIARLSYGLGATEFEFNSAHISLPAYDLRLSAPSLTGGIGGDEQSAELRAGVLDQAANQRFPPMNGRLRADLSDVTRIPLTGSLSGLKNRLQIALNGVLEPDSGALTLSAKANPLLFIPGGVQPGELHPVLKAMENAQGELRAEASFRLTGGNFVSNGVVSLKNASFTTPLGAYQGFNSEIVLSSLWPPRTEPGQEVAIERIEIEEFPFEDLVGRFHLTAPEDPELSAGLPDVAIEEAQLTFAEGKFRVRDMRVRPLSENQDSVIEVESLDLTKFFELLDIEDVAASGRMSGVIPVSLRGDGVIINGAYLAADGPGVLNINSAEAQAALLPADDYIGDLVDALKDFRYELLTIGVNKPLEGDTIVTMRILGKNPEVLYGASFDLNVNLETDLAPVLRALRDAQDLREELESGFIEQMR